MAQLQIHDEGNVGGGSVGVSIGKGGRSGDGCVCNGRSVVASTSGM